MTERDKKLITLLAVVVILVVFFNYFFIPLKKESDELDASIETAQLQKSEMEVKIASLPILEGNFEDLKQKYPVSAQDYYPVMTSQEIDREITGMVLN
ncbi:MAG: type II secretion system protein GspM, partial [Lachnospiraceae bacterium]|nr:type II secretion system protein GspM [Lachnospiraceae bacterium]